MKNRYVGRTFIMPDQRTRELSVRRKLNAMRSVFNGKRVLLIDDSIVRGTTSRKILQLCRDAGAKEIHVRISCPPTVHPCLYGIDTPFNWGLVRFMHSREQQKFLRKQEIAETLKTAAEEPPKAEVKAEPIADAEAEPTETKAADKKAKPAEPAS